MEDERNGNFLDMLNIWVIWGFHNYNVDVLEQLDVKVLTQVRAWQKWTNKVLM